MTTPLYPKFQKRISDEFDQLIRAQVDPWAFLNSGNSIHLKKFDGSDIHYQGVGFEGSPRTVFWSRYVEPFIEDIVLRSIDEAIKAAQERKVDGAALLLEVQGLFISYARKVFDRMATIDRRLRGRGHPNNVALRSVDREHAEVKSFIEVHIRAELEMWNSVSGSSVVSQSELLTNTELKLLLALFLEQQNGRDVNAKRFRAQNDEYLDVITELVANGWIEDRDGQYTVKLVGVAALVHVNSAANSLMYLCGHMFDYLKRQYKQDPDKKISVTELANIVDMPIIEVRKALPYLREASLFGGYATDLNSADAYVILSEDLIRHKSFSEIIEKYREWIAGRSKERNAAIKNVVKPGPDIVRKEKMVSTPLERYTLIKQIGQGGAGLVIEAKNESGVRVAIKHLSSTVASETIRTRFRNEIRFGLAIRHKNIVPVIDVGSGDFGHGDSLFFVMPLYGQTLRVAMDRGSLSPGICIRIFIEILNGVKEAHGHSVWHRDIKPENILLNDDMSEVRVGDFGIAHYSEDELYSAAETRAADRLANFKYAAPEQRDRRASKDHRVDIFSLGLLLNELFTGVVPHGSDFRRIGDSHREFSKLDDLVLKMIRQEPEKRLQSIDEVLSELIRHGFLNGKYQSDEGAPVTSISKASDGSEDGRGILTEDFKKWLREKRDGEEEKRRTIQSVLDAMREIGPLRADELVRLSPISTMELEEMGHIEFANEHWRVRERVAESPKTMPITNAGNARESVVTPTVLLAATPMSGEAQVLLKEAVSDSSGTVMFLRHLGGVTLQVNGKNLIIDQSRRNVAAWESAIAELVTRGLLVQRGREVYEVTKNGFEAAEAI